MAKQNNLLNDNIELGEMNMRNFNEYLVTKFGQNEADFMVDGHIEAVVPMADKEENRIDVFYMNDFLSLSVFYGDFEDRYFRAMCAFIDNYNEKEDCTYELRYLNGQIWVEVDEMGVDAQKAIAIMEDVIKFFADDGEIAGQIREVVSDAELRQKLIHERVQLLKSRAGQCEIHGDHQAAMELLKEVCELYYGYGHMELIALHYHHGLDKPHIGLFFPKNTEYALECMMLAVEQDTDNIYAPVLAYGMAKELGNEELCKKIAAIGQKRGSWECVALRVSERSADFLPRIASYYREGIGCRKSQRNAKYYDRLAAGERQTVFRDMLVNGFDRVFSLMNDEEYYRIHSLVELEGISQAFQERLLYGSNKRTLGLPAWFVPLVNGLNAEERDLVLATARERMEEDIRALSEKVQQGKIISLASDSDDGGVLFEDEDGLQYVYAPDLKKLVDCEAKSKLLAVFSTLKDLH